MSDSRKQFTDTEYITEAQFKGRSRRSFLLGGAASVAGFAGWRWIQGQEADNRIPQVLRDGHEFNEDLWASLFREDHLAPTYDKSESSILRVNGRHGIRNEIDMSVWRLQVLGPDGETWGSHTLDDILALDRNEMTIEHKCIEGWSQITTWGGALFSDFAALYGVEQDDFTYVSLRTPTPDQYVDQSEDDRDYYVSVDSPSMFHAQTLLAYDMLDGRLDQAHGAPLRLATPLKYGIKHIKGIGSIQFTDELPDDYWGERGYSWYAHL